MLSEAAGMAIKSKLLLLALVVMSVFASAHKPPVVEDHEASVPLSEPMAPLDLGGVGKMRFGGYAPSFDGDEKQDGVAREMMNQETDITIPPVNIPPVTIPPVTIPHESPVVGLIPIIQGGDGSFHIGIGPIDFGGSIGWGGFTPGLPQPYVVVSPYMSPYVPPSTGQPSQSIPSYPSAPGYAQNPSQTGGSSQGSFQMGGSAQGSFQMGGSAQGSYQIPGSASAPGSSQIGGTVSNKSN